MSAPNQITRRSALGAMAAGLAAPFVWRHTAGAAPSETVLHASFGASGMAGSDIGSLTGSKHLKLVAVADVDLGRTADVKKRFPGVRVYQDWRELLDKEKDLRLGQRLDPGPHARPDHDERHAPGAATCTPRSRSPRPSTRPGSSRRPRPTRRWSARWASRSTRRPSTGRSWRSIQSGAIGKVKEVHSWSGKQWGDRGPRPDRKDPVPDGFDWDKLARRGGRAAVHW